MAIRRIAIFYLIFLISSCHKTKEKVEDEVCDTTVDILIEADHPYIEYTGRIDFRKPKEPVFSYPAISIRAWFEGPAIDMVLKDYARLKDLYGDTSHNFYNIILDGKVEKILQTNRNQETYRLFRGLKDTTHSIEIFKRTETRVGRSKFLGFRLAEGKSLVEPPPSNNRKIEFIGNSITAGYGNESQRRDSTVTAKTQNAYMAYSAITARNLEAEYMCVAFSGIGVYRNSDGSERSTMPDIYERTLPNAFFPKWDFSRFVPNVVVVNLGTNDFSLQYIDANRFYQEYYRFIARLRKYYPKAKIVCLLSPMITDAVPLHENARQIARRTYQAVVNQFNTSGDKNVYFFELSLQKGDLGYGG